MDAAWAIMFDRAVNNDLMAAKAGQPARALDDLHAAVWGPPEVDVPDDGDETAALAEMAALMGRLDGEV